MYVYDIRKDMTKKAYKEMKKANRVMNGFNTGERLFKGKKNRSRAQSKRNFQQGLDKALNQ